jgi:hypothetical protein
MRNGMVLRVVELRCSYATVNCERHRRRGQQSLTVFSEVMLACQSLILCIFGCDLRLYGFAIGVIIRQRGVDLR